MPSVGGGEDVQKLKERVSMGRPWIFSGHAHSSTENAAYNILI